MRSNAQRSKAPLKTTTDHAPAIDRPYTRRSQDLDLRSQSGVTQGGRLRHDLFGIPVSADANRTGSSGEPFSAALRGQAGARQVGNTASTPPNLGPATTIDRSSRRLVQRIPFFQLISRTSADSLGFDSKQAGEEDHREPIDLIAGPEDKAASQDSISSTITLVPTVSRGGAAPSATQFGVTNSRASFSSIVVTPGSGSFTVTANLDLTITWQARSGTGPSSELDIQDENDRDITHENYPTVASDLTPNMSSDNGRPPRTMFWAQDLTERHELFHTRQRSGPWGAARAAAIKAYLDGRTATTSAEITSTLLPAALTEGQRVFNALASAPAAEGDAYGDGAPLYRARANAITAKGDSGGYLLGDFPLPDPNGPRYA